MPALPDGTLDSRVVALPASPTRPAVRANGEKMGREGREGGASWARIGDVGEVVGMRVDH